MNPSNETTPVCAKCHAEGVELYPAKCEEKPELFKGYPIGMYHCPDCGIMLIAGFEHPPLCEKCNSSILMEKNPTCQCEEFATPSSEYEKLAAVVSSISCILIKVANLEKEIEQIKAENKEKS